MGPNQGWPFFRFGVHGGGGGVPLSWQNNKQNVLSTVGGNLFLSLSVAHQGSPLNFSPLAGSLGGFFPLLGPCPDILKPIFSFSPDRGGGVGVLLEPRGGEDTRLGGKLSTFPKTKPKPKGLWVFRLVRPTCVFLNPPYKHLSPKKRGRKSNCFFFFPYPPHDTGEPFGRPEHLRLGLHKHSAGVQAGTGSDMPVPPFP